MALSITTGGPLGTSSPINTSAKPLLKIIQEVCPRIGLTVPDAVFSSTRREHIELQEIASEAAQSILELRDWTKLKFLGTLTGDGASEAFALPDDFKRMIRRARLWSNIRPLQPLTQYVETDDWLADATTGWLTPFGSWALIGNEIQIRPTLASGTEISFYYISSYYAQDASGLFKPEFTADTDYFALDSRLLKLAMVWQWKSAKGFPYAEDMATFEQALASLARSDQGPLPVVGDRSGNFITVKTAFSGTVTG